MTHLFYFRLSRLCPGVLCLLLIARLAAAQDQLTNQPVNPTPGTARPSLTGARVIAGRLFFSATSPASPTRELAVTDGSAAGTKLIRSIVPVPRQVTEPQSFTEYNGNAYFSASDGVNGRELWVSNGNDSGTQMVKDIVPGAGSSNPRQLAVVNGKLYFIATGMSFVDELWVSDGTNVGTQRLADVLGMSIGGTVREIVAAGTRLFFSTFTNDLWVTDGTVAGTRFLKGGPLNPANPMGPRFFTSISQLTNFDGRLLFRGNVVGLYEDEPWFSDGTPEGTNVINIQPDVPGPLGSFPVSPFVYFKGLMFFTASQPSSRLMATDGTLAGTQLIKTGFATNLTQFDGRLFFTLNQRELWATDGTAAGTQLVRDFSQGSVSPNPGNLIVSNNKLYLLTVPTFPSSGRVLWESDGTTAGTKVVPVNPPLVGYVSGAVNLNDNVLFTTSDDAPSGVQLFKVTPPAPPVVVPFPDRTATVGVYYFQSIAPILSYSGPTSYKMEGLPPGLVFDGGSGGLIGGTPTTAGVYSVTYSVSNMFGITIGLAYFNFIVNPAGGSPTPFALITPIYDCSSGGFTLRTSGGNGSTIEYQIPGITDWTNNPVGTIPVQIRQDANSMPLMLRARQNGLVVSLPFNFVAACGSGGGGGALVLLAPTYNCSTGAITFNTTGGDGSPITFTAPGIGRASATSNTGTVEAGLRADPKPIVITATQNGVTVSYTFNPACGGARQAATEPTEGLQVRLLGNPTVGERIDVEISGAEGQAMQLTLANTQGRVLTEESIERASPTEHRSLRVSGNAGVYLLRVSTPTQSRTVKVLR